MSVIFQQQPYHHEEPNRAHEIGQIVMHLQDHPQQQYYSNGPNYYTPKSEIYVNTNETHGNEDHRFEERMDFEGNYVGYNSDSAYDYGYGNSGQRDYHELQNGKTMVSNYSNRALHKNEILEKFFF